MTPLIQALHDTQKELDVLKKAEASAPEGVNDFLQLREELNRAGAELARLVLRPAHVLPFLVPGRTIRLRQGDWEWGWGLLVRVRRKRRKGPGQGVQVSVDASGLALTLEVLLEEEGVPRIRSFGLSSVVCLGVAKMHVNQRDLLSSDFLQKATLRAFKRLKSAFPDGLPPLDPIVRPNLRATTLTLSSASNCTYFNNFHPCTQGHLGVSPDDPDLQRALR